MRKAHLWIGLVASVLIFMETSRQAQGHTGTRNGQFQDSDGFAGTANFTPGLRGRESQGIIGTIRSLHEGRIGTTDVKWLIDLTAVAMMFLTGSGIYLSILYPFAYSLKNDSVSNQDHDGEECKRYEKQRKI